VREEREEEARSSPPDLIVLMDGAIGASGRHPPGAERVKGSHTPPRTIPTHDRAPPRAGLLSLIFSFGFDDGVEAASKLLQRNGLARAPSGGTISSLSFPLSHP